PRTPPRLACGWGIPIFTIGTRVSPYRFLLAERLQWFGFFVPTSLSIERREVDQALGHIGMVWAEGLLPDRQRALVDPSVYLLPAETDPVPRDRKSTRLNSSHQIISYAVFCLKKKNIGKKPHSNTATDAWLLTTSNTDT